MHQGVVTNELVVILAYAYSQLNDNDKAIQLLNGKQGPLVFVAKAQFCARK